jgi:hypothetical protein
MLLPKLGGFWLLPPRDFPHQMRVTLWITTAIHLDTPIRMPGTTVNTWDRPFRKNIFPDAHGVKRLKINWRARATESGSTERSMTGL